MNKALIDNWNRTVPHDGVVYHLGDMFFKNMQSSLEILARLNGKIRLIRGNHRGIDPKIAKKRPDKIDWLGDYFELTIQDEDAPMGKQMIVLCHTAFLTWNKSHWGSWNLFGHSHDNLTPWINEHLPEARMLDVGVDAVAHISKGLRPNQEVNPRDYRPLSYEEIKTLLQYKTGEVVDHHSPEEIEL